MYVGLESVKEVGRKIEINAVVDETPHTFVLLSRSVDNAKFREKDTAFFEEEMRLARGEYNDWYCAFLANTEILKFATNFTEDVDRKVTECLKAMRLARCKIAKNEAILLALKAK